MYLKISLQVSKPNIPSVSTDTGKEENPKFSELNPRGR